jgi:hypothetical protein
LTGRPIWLSHLRFIAAGATFCPLMALLGAKRPQDRGWQFVVLSLLGMIVFYALTELAYRPDRPPALHWVVRWLLIVPLVVIGLMNHVLTRYWLPATLVALGQALLFWPQFPELQGRLPTWLNDAARAGDTVALAGIACLSAAVLVVSLWQFSWRVADEPRILATSATGLNRLWLDFRDSFGALWGLRVAARFNQSAEQLDWPVRLAWGGLRPTARVPEGTADSPPPHQRAMRQVLESMLRRFVDNSWLASRWPDGREPRAAPQHLSPGAGAGFAESAGAARSGEPRTASLQG